MNATQNVNMGIRESILTAAKPEIRVRKNPADCDSNSRLCCWST